jgi:hypothetical protein
MRLSDIHLKTTSLPLDHPKWRHPMPSHELARLGLEHWAQDLITGPDVVLAMLCQELFIHSTGISSKDITDHQYSLITSSNILNLVAGTHGYKVSRRAEYGASATSTTTRNIKPAEQWSSQPANFSEKRELEEKGAALLETFNSLKSQLEENKAKVEDLRKHQSALKTETVCLTSSANTSWIFTDFSQPGFNQGR